jgi:hypothetical protein
MTVVPTFTSLADVYGPDGASELVTNSYFTSTDVEILQPRPIECRR